MTRFPPLVEAAMTPEQRAVSDALTQGPRGGVSGPFSAWIYAPNLASRLEKLGNYLRFESSLTVRITELTILIVARRWRASFIWRHHLQLARKGGLADEVIEHLRFGTRPRSAKSDELAAHDLVASLLDHGPVNDEVWSAARHAFSETGVADLIGLAGYYSLVAMTLKTAHTEVDDGALFNQRPTEAGNIGEP